MECYGRSYGKKEACATCEMAPWCKDAADPVYSNEVELDAGRHAVAEKHTPEEEKPTYTFSQMAELIRLLIFFDDPRLRQIVQWKFEDPDISLSEIGRRYRISKQAVRKDIKLAIRYCPALAAILCNRPMYNAWRKRRHDVPARIPRRVKQPIVVQLEQPELF